MPFQTTLNLTHLPLFVRALAAGVIDGAADHVFVFIAARKIPPTVFESVAEAIGDSKDMKLFIFDRDALLKLYGPTLSRHPAFHTQAVLAQQKAQGGFGSVDSDGGGSSAKKQPSRCAGWAH